METTEAERKQKAALIRGDIGPPWQPPSGVADFVDRLCRDLDAALLALRDGQRDGGGRLVIRVAVLGLPAIDKSPEEVARELVALWQQATRDAEYAVTKVIDQGPRTEAELLRGHNLEFNVCVELERDQPGTIPAA